MPRVVQTGTATISQGGLNLFGDICLSNRNAEYIKDRKFEDSNLRKSAITKSSMISRVFYLSIYKKHHST